MGSQPEDDGDAAGMSIRLVMAPWDARCRVPTSFRLRKRERDGTACLYETYSERGCGTNVAAASLMRASNVAFWSGSVRGVIVRRVRQDRIGESLI
jgi:hypothetical protein